MSDFELALQKLTHKEGDKWVGSGIFEIFRISDPNYFRIEFRFVYIEHKSCYLQIVYELNSDRNV